MLTRDVDYFRRRAEVELAQARTAASERASEAHHALAALYIERLRGFTKERVSTAEYAPSAAAT